ncbi:hypothetical protein RJ641_004368 [Dillenia turbinata]|uniref:DUF7787 domain-containing protein n=1 Tax=Dillenia turbinata TaxID=194707 RepID=A0AAN8VEL3_9MAGN
MARVREKRKLWLEDYEAFMETLISVKGQIDFEKETSVFPTLRAIFNSNFRRFSIDQLNQIIEMHGFIKIHRCPKKDVLEATSCIDLTLPKRSTIDENISAYNSYSSIDEINQALAALEWQECPVKFVEALNSPPMEENTENHNLNPNHLKIKRRQRKSKRNPSLNFTIAKKLRTKELRKMKKIDSIISDRKLDDDDVEVL